MSSRAGDLIREAFRDLHPETGDICYLLGYVAYYVPEEVVIAGIADVRDRIAQRSHRPDANPQPTEIVAPSSLEDRSAVVA
jgi:hypothetical protein